MATKTKIKTKRVKLYMRRKGEAKKLAKLQAQGWQVLSQVKQEDLLGRDTGWVTYMLTKGGAPVEPVPAAPAPPTVPAGWHPDPHGQAGVLRYWDGAQWTSHTTSSSN